MMGLGVDGVFVGSGIFKSSDPEAYARAIVEATTFWSEPEVVAKVSRGLGGAMPGIEMEMLSEAEQLARRGW
jgi:pyridoxal 5'-phosphate synthase pdxS subunit